MRWLRQLFKPTTPIERAPFIDEILGRVVWSDAEETWVVPESANRPFVIHIPGAEAPEITLLPWAREIAERSSQFSQTILSFVSKTIAQWGPEAARLADLEIEVVALHSPDRTGMVFFHFAEPNPAWRCDLIAGIPKNLGCDT